METRSPLYNIVVNLLSFYDTDKDNNTYTDKFTPYNLLSSIKKPFLSEYGRAITDSYFKFCATQKQVDLDYMFRISNDRLSFIKSRTSPYHVIMNETKSVSDLEKYLNRLKNNQDYNFVWDEDEVFLHIHDNLCVYKNALYLPEYLVVDYKETSKDTYVPNIEYDERNNEFNIMVGYLMKKHKELNIK